MQRTLNRIRPGSTGSKIVRGGKEYFDLLLAMINNAGESIHLQTYIYDDDETGNVIAHALKEAVKRNVSIYMMADGYASQVMSQRFINDLRNSGIHFRFFEPLLRSRYFYFGRRLHHKVVVVDQKYALVGGVNISDRYNDMPWKPAWLDFALYVEGDVAVDLHILCWKAWNGFSSKKEPGSSTSGTAFNANHPARVGVRIRRNDWIRRKNEIYETYCYMFSNAKSQITIVCSYFLPGNKLRDLLSKASARGVRIRILTAGRSDIMMSKYAERWLYDWLLRNNISIYEYQASILHAKVAVCDNEWLTIGSYNVNNISAYASIELNLDVFDTGIALEAEQIINDLITHHSKPITPRFHQQSTTVFKQFGRWLSFQVIRRVFDLLTFYYKQRG